MRECWIMLMTCLLIPLRLSHSRHPSIHWFSATSISSPFLSLPVASAMEIDGHISSRGFFYFLGLCAMIFNWFKRLRSDDDIFGSTHFCLTTTTHSNVFTHRQLMLYHCIDFFPPFFKKIFYKIESSQFLFFFVIFFCFHAVIDTQSNRRFILFSMVDP
jgi:hypothetical protein